MKRNIFLVEVNNYKTTLSYQTFCPNNNNCSLSQQNNNFFILFQTWFQTLVWFPSLSGRRCTFTPATYCEAFVSLLFLGKVLVGLHFTHYENFFWNGLTFYLERISASSFLVACCCCVLWKVMNSSTIWLFLFLFACDDDDCWFVTRKKGPGHCVAFARNYVIICGTGRQPYFGRLLFWFFVFFFLLSWTLGKTIVNRCALARHAMNSS